MISLCRITTNGGAAFEDCGGFLRAFLSHHFFLIKPKRSFLLYLTETFPSILGCGSLFLSPKSDPMEGYYGRGIDVLSVTQDQEPSDRLPSPDSWSRWGILRPGTLEGNVDSNGGAGDDHRIDLYLDLLDKYQPSYVDSPVEEETEDDFFYRNSFLTDFHSTQNERKHEPFCFCPQCDHDVFPAGDSWLDIISSTGLSKRDKKLVELEEQSFFASGDLCEIPTVPLNMKDYPLLEDSPSSIGTIVPSGQFGPYHQTISETSPEEVALEELKMVMTLLSNRTRICFRDALYRLADNSKQRPKRSGVQKGGSSIRKPVSWTDERSSKEANESKTNVVDRAIANIMFNRMDSNLQEDNLESEPADLNLVNLCASEEQCSSSKLHLACHDESELQFSHEFEVPVLGRSDG